MSIFHVRHRVQEANTNGGGGGDGGAAAAAAAAAAAGGAAEWLKPFGEHAKVFEGIKDPAELATKWTAANSELTTLKGKTFDFRSLADPTDEKATKFLSRFTDPKAFMKTVLEAQGKLGERDAHKPLAKDATPEQVNEWRAANGIPLEPKGYFEKLPNGMVIGKEDQPAFDRYGAIWHKHNLPPAAAHEMAQAYYEDQQAVKAEEAKVDRADQAKSIQELRTKWGNDYAPNMAILTNFLEGLPADIQPLFKDATLADGTRLMNSAAVIEFFAKAARELNPAAHLIPPGGEGNMGSIDSEIAAMKALMADLNSKYHKGPEAAKMQERYRQLITAQQQLASRK